MSTLWSASAFGPVVVPLLLCAAIVLSSLAWLLPDHRTASGPDQPATSGRFSVPILLSALSALFIIVALVLVSLPGTNPDRAPTVLTPVTVILTMAIATIGGGPFTTAILQLATRSTSGPHGGIVVSASGSDTAVGADGSSGAAEPTKPIEVLRGGTTIGLLERAAAAGAILAGFPEAIAVVVALKGVGRFTELSTSEAKERFIIGSIASLLWACACALLVR